MRVKSWMVVGMLVSLGVTSMIVHATIPLEGTKWQITITPDAVAKKAGEKSSKDSLIFKDGQVTSTACVKYGFQHSPYTATETAAGPAFQTEQVSKKEGTMTWLGHVTGSAMSGTVVWTKKNGQTLHYTFAGKKGKSS